MKVARTELLPPILTALEVALDCPVVADLNRCTEILQDGTPGTTTRDSAGAALRTYQIDFRSLDPAPIGQMVNAFSADKTVRRVASDLYEARRLRYLAGGEPDMIRVCLLRYYFVLEQIGRDLGYTGERDSARVAEAEVIVAGLRQALTGLDTDIRGETLIRDAARDLRVVDRLFTQDQIEHAGQRLSVSAENLGAARRFVAYRNSTLGHGGRRLDRGELREWLRTVPDLVGAFWTPYARLKGLTRTR